MRRECSCVHAVACVLRAWRVDVSVMSHVRQRVCQGLLDKLEAAGRAWH
jgi:hypothetical protein